MSRLDAPPIVSVIIANLNGRRWLEQCLPTLAAQTLRDFEIVVVDNGSTDGSVAWLETQWPAVRVLPQTRNLGFAAANNRGVSATRSPYVVVLNNDTRADPEFLAALVTAVDAPDVGMVAPQIVRWNAPATLDAAGITVDWAGMAWNRGWNQPVATAAVSCDVFGPSGAAALYTRAMLDAVGLFDEDFFMYYEDVDLAWRAQRAGWRCRYTPQARVAHWHSATAVTVSDLKTYLVSRNRLWTAAKNLPWPHWLLALPLVVGYDAAALLARTLRERRFTALRARAAALRGLPAMLRKRSPTRVRPPLERPWPFRRG